MIVLSILADLTWPAQREACHERLGLYAMSTSSHKHKDNLQHAKNCTICMSEQIAPTWQDTASNWHIAGEGAFLVHICACRTPQIVFQLFKDATLLMASQNLEKVLQTGSFGGLWVALGLWILNSQWVVALADPVSSLTKYHQGEANDADSRRIIYRIESSW